MKRNWLVSTLCIVLVISNFSVSISHSLKIVAFDNSLRNEPGFFTPDGGERIRIKNGNTLIVAGKINGVMMTRGEIGWLEYPVKAKPHFKVSLKKFEAAKTAPETIIFLLAIIQRRDSSLDILAAEIPVMFPDEFPTNYKNDVKWWGNINKQQLHSCLPDGTAKLLTMDLDIGDKCSLACSHCFRRDKRVDIITNPLTHEEIVGYVKQAKVFGLQEIKILGRGEPFENSRFLEFLREVSGLGIGIAIFTKGHILGCDELARKYNAGYGINTGWELIQALKELNVSILLGFNSFSRSTQENFVGVDKYPSTALLKNYVEFRDKALINLVKAGFNEYVYSS